MMDRSKETARRLAYALYERTEDANAIDLLAKALNYMPSQLKEDMADLWAELTKQEGASNE